jgi:hypothetical protein
VLRENSNAGSVRSTGNDAFIAESQSDAAHFFLGSRTAQNMFMMN